MTPDDSDTEEDGSDDDDDNEPMPALMVGPVLDPASQSGNKPESDSMFDPLGYSPDKQETQHCPTNCNLPRPPVPDDASVQDD